MNDLLVSWLESAGFSHFDKSRYNFKDGSYIKAYPKFLERMDFPESMANIPELVPVLLKMVSNKKIPPQELKDAMDSLTSLWVESNSPKNVEYNLQDFELDSSNSELLGYVSRLVPFINASKQGDRVFFIDPLTKKMVTELATDLICAKQLTTEEDLIRNPMTPLGMVKFNPYNLNSLYKEKFMGMTVSILNLYVPPKWRALNVEPKFHGMIKDLITHLFPIEDEREAVIDWLHHSLVNRCETVLILVGSRGTGKGLLLNEIQSALIGEAFREIVGQSILMEKFNGSFNNKRYLLFDEVDISGSEELKKFKAFSNNSIAIESKGKDASTIENYVSMALTSNERKHIRILPSERRFSIPEVTEINFNTQYSDKEISEFVVRLSDPESTEIAEFGKWLLNRKPKNTPRSQIKGRYYMEISRMSMEEWKLFLVEYIIDFGVEGEVIKNRELSKEFKSVYGKAHTWPSKKATIEDFLLDYLHEGTHKIGSISLYKDSDKGRESFGTLPNPLFLSKFGKKKNSDPDIEQKVNSVFDRSKIVKE